MRISSAFLLLLLASCSSSPVPGPLIQLSPLAIDPLPLTLPFAEIEAESGQTTGAFSAFTTAHHDAGAEASGRRYVTLPPGSKLVVTAPVRADSLVVRYSWPETADGTLLVAAGAAPAVPLTVTSRYSWEFGRPSWGSNNVWDEASGEPRHFWDEASLRTPVFEAGDEVVLSNPETAKAAVLVDLLDFELVAPAVAAPQDSLSFADFHPDATGRTDVTALLQKAVDKAKGGTLYIPEGIYRTDAVYLGNVTVVGAGLWRTRFVGPLSQFRFEGKKASLSDFAIFGETHTRDDTSDEENGFAGNPGAGSSISRVWVEHKKCAFWVGNWGGKNPVTGLTLAECRFRNLMADAVNLCSGTNGAVVRDCLVRNSGDDALAAWSPKNGGPAGGSNTFLRNYVQLPWVASGIALYGGGPFLVQGNVIKDTVTTGSGIYISANFGAWPFAGLVDVRENLLIRAGAHESDPSGTTGAIRLLAGDASMKGGRYVFTDNTVLDPLESAFSFQGPHDLGKTEVHGLTVRLGSASLADVKRNVSGGGATFDGVVGGQDVPDRSEFTF